jgi:hypothetical protein
MQQRRRARRAGHRGSQRTMSDHLALMDESKAWFSDLEWTAREEMRAFGRIDSAVKDAVKETGYAAPDALRLQRRIGAQPAVETIWQYYRAEMKQAYRR